jgi:hypothetical protein
MTKAISMKKTAVVSAAASMVTMRVRRLENLVVPLVGRAMMRESNSATSVNAHAIGWSTRTLVSVRVVRLTRWVIPLSCY